MSFNTTDYFLDDLCLKITDGSHQSPKAFDGGMPMFSVKDMTEFGFDFSSVKTISKVDYDKLVDQGCRPLEGDVLIAKDGSVLKHVFKVEKDLDAVLLSSIALLRPNTDLINPDYLVYSLKEPSLQNNIKSNYVSGSGVPRIVLKDFKKIPLTIPSLDYQNEVVNHIKSIDRKIQVNQQTNDTLEAMAQGIFKSWFVDFDPVVFNAVRAGHPVPERFEETAARYRESPETQRLPRDILDLFPDRFEESELGEIPAGWEEKKLSEIAFVVDCLHSKKPVRQKTGRLMIQVYNVGETGRLDFSDSYYISQSDYEMWTKRMEIRPGDLVITKTGRVGAIGQMPEGNRAAMGRNMVGIRSVPGKNTPCFIKDLFLCDRMQVEITRNTNDGTILKSLHVKSVNQLCVTMPDCKTVQLYEKYVKPLHSKLERNDKESRVLGSVRDTLLPKLISGELRVPDAEAFLEGGVM